MPITKMQDIVEELEHLRSEIVATRQETKVLARLLGLEDQLNAALLEHQIQQEADARARQQRRQKFLGSDLGNAD
jgi:Holliday junction resolvasome RuvABC endonuclease subunit